MCWLYVVLGAHLCLAMCGAWSSGVASSFEVVRPGSRSSLLLVCQEVGVILFCWRLQVLFYL